MNSSYRLILKKTGEKMNSVIDKIQLKIYTLTQKKWGINLALGWGINLNLDTFVISQQKWTRYHFFRKHPIGLLWFFDPSQAIAYFL